MKIVGHQKQIENLENMQKRNALPHALLFSGPPAIGKKKVALEIARKILNPTEDSQTDALISHGNHPDLHILKKLEDKKEILAEQVRELCSKIKLKPYQSDSTVAIIDDAHELNITAANALLMTLEEPPGHSHIILISSSPHKLPETIISRCQIMSFAGLNEEQLIEVSSALFPSLDENAIRNICRLCEDGLEALSLDGFIDERTFELNDEKAAIKHMREVAKSISEIEKKVNFLIDESSDYKRATEIAGEIAAEKADYKRNLQIIQRSLRKKLRENSKLSDVFAQSIEVEENILRRNLNPQLQITSLMLAIAAGN